MLIYLKAKYLEAFFEKLSGRGKTIVSVSKSTAEETQRYFKLNTHTVIENAVDTDLFKPRAEKNSCEENLVYLLINFSVNSWGD